MRTGGSVYKRCPCGTTGTSGRPACKKNHGTWWWRAEAPRSATGGKRRQPSKGGYPTKASAEAGLVEFVGDRNDGRWRDDEGITAGRWFDRWLASGRWEALTRATYESHLRSIWRDHIGDRRLRDLRKHHIEAVLREVALRGDGRPRGARTLASYVRTLSAALAAAVDAGLLSENVAKGRMKAVPSVGRPELMLWEADELRLFLDSVQHDPFFPLWVVAAYTGLRRGELCGMRWEDVDLTGKHPGIEVRQTVVALAGQQPCRVCGGEHTGALIKVETAASRGPKSNAGKRWVPLVQEAVDALAAHRVHQEARRALWGDDYDDHGLVFPKDDGSPVNPSALTQRFKRLVVDVRSADDPEFRLPVIRPHDMRHGAASLMIAAGVPIETVSLILGHSSTATTRQIYTHVMRGPAADAVRAAASLVRPSPDRAQSVHTTPGSGESGEVDDQENSSSEASDAATGSDRHCITNSSEPVSDDDGD